MAPTPLPSHTQYSAARVSTARILLALATLIGVVLISGTLSSTANNTGALSYSATEALVQQGPESLSTSSPPGSLLSQNASVVVPAGQVYIGFDNLPRGTVVHVQYPQAIFTTETVWYLLAHSQFAYRSTFPNILDHGPLVYPHGLVPLYVDFPTPVNDLRFYVLAVDYFRRTVAKVNIYQNHRLTPTATKDIDGFGQAYIPVLVDVSAWGFNNVTRIEVVDIIDVNGIGYDDFSFTLAPAPTPTPTPPQVPPAPTNLTASERGRPRPHLPRYNKR